MIVYSFIILIKKNSFVYILTNRVYQYDKFKSTTNITNEQQ